VLEQQRFRNNGADTTTTKQCRDGDEEVNREKEQFAHGWNAITCATLRKTPREAQLALRSGG